MFCSDIVPALTDLNLADNQLYDLNFEFECIKNLRLLDVSYNKLKRLSNRTMERIDTFFGQPKTSRDRSRTINVIANPYVCDCNMRPMFFGLIHPMPICINGTKCDAILEFQILMLVSKY